MASPGDKDKEEFEINEVLPDGSLRHKLVWVQPKGGNPTSTTSLETIIKPPHLVQSKDEIEEVLADGTRIKRPVVMNRMVQSIKTRHESVDKGEVNDYEVEEVVPGTESAFTSNVDSDYDESLKFSRRCRDYTGNYPDEVEMVEDETVLPDGTIHHRVIHSRSSIKSPSGDISQKTTSEILETFEQPPKLMQQTEEIEETLPDGTKVKRNIVSNRMVHLIKTRRESFEKGVNLVENYEVEEVLPGTESAFDEGLDSDYEKEMDNKIVCDREEEEILPDGTIHHKTYHVRPSSGDKQHTSGSEILESFENPPHLVQDLEDIEETLPDGSKVTRRVSMNRMVHSFKVHRESLEDGSKLVDDYEVEEVIPGTESAFDAGVDSDYEEEMECKHHVQDMLSK